MKDEKEKGYTGEGILFAAMLCGMFCVYVDRMSFSWNLTRWGAYSFVFLLIITACVAVINNKWRKLKFWLYAATVAAVCVGLCLVWAE